MTSDFNDSEEKNDGLAADAERGSALTEVKKEGPLDWKKPLEAALPPHNPPFTFRSLAETLAFTALAILLALMWMYSSVLGLLIPVAFPLLFFVLALRRGMLCGALALVLETVILAYAADAFAALYIFLQAGLVGIFFAYAFMTGKRAGYILMFGMILTACGVIATIAISPYLSGLSWSGLILQMEELMNAVFDQMARITDISAALPQGMTLAEYRTMLVEMMVKIIPGTMVIMALIQVYISYLFAVMIGGRYRLPVAKLPPFEEWRLHWLLVWGVIIGLALRGVGSRFSLAVVNQIAANIMYVYYPLLLVCGVALLIWFLRRWRAGLFIKLFFVIIFSYNLSFSFFSLIVLAVFDPLLDFRGKLKILMSNNVKK